jgi:hypothetical protein
MQGVMMEKLIGGQAIADYLGISRTHFFRLKSEFKGTDWAMPVFERLVGMPGRRHKEIYTYPMAIQSWWFQYKNM